MDEETKKILHAGAHQALDKFGPDIARGLGCMVNLLVALTGIGAFSAIVVVLFA